MNEGWIFIVEGKLLEDRRQERGPEQAPAPVWVTSGGERQTNAGSGYRGGAASIGGGEVVGHRVERVRLELCESPSQLPFNPVDGMEKQAAIHLHLPAAEFPV